MKHIYYANIEPGALPLFDIIYGSNPKVYWPFDNSDLPHYYPQYYRGLRPGWIYQSYLRDNADWTNWRVMPPEFESFGTVRQTHNKLTSIFKRHGHYLLVQRENCCKLLRQGTSILDDWQCYMCIGVTYSPEPFLLQELPEVRFLNAFRVNDTIP